VRLLIGHVHARFIPARLCYARLQVVGHHDLSHAAQKPEGSDLRTDPVGQPLCPRGLGKGVTAGTGHGNEQLRLPPITGDAIRYGYGFARVVDEQLFARAVLLPQNYFLSSPPSLVQLAEPAVAVTIRMNRTILLPDELQGQVLMFLQFGVDAGVIGLR